MAKAEDVRAEERTQRALDADVPTIHFNGFVNGITTGDILTVLERNAVPVGILNMSFTVAKTLSVSLGSLIASIEEASGRTIMTTRELQTFLEKQSGKVETKAKKKSSKTKR